MLSCHLQFERGPGVGLWPSGPRRGIIGPAPQVARAPAGPPGAQVCAGVIHIVLFTGFIILSLRSITLVFLGIFEGFHLPGLGGSFGHVYHILKDLGATAVLVAVIVAVVRRLVFRPQRYSVPARYGKEHTWEAVLVLLLIMALVTADFLFEGSHAAARR